MELIFSNFPVARKKGNTRIREHFVGLKINLTHNLEVDGLGGVLALQVVRGAGVVAGPVAVDLLQHEVLPARHDPDLLLGALGHAQTLQVRQ